MSERALFVYGSLKRGFKNHHQLSGATFVSTARTQKGYQLLLAGEYPVLVESESGSVQGELFSVSSELLAALDAFEGSEYMRKAVLLEGEVQAFAYVAAPHRAKAGVLLESDAWDEEPGAERSLR
jgi:gamma-glutamylcyclotransferase (GGCT)/AIG2-like uncharacterized protein YtfP